MGEEGQGGDRRGVMMDVLSIYIPSFFNMMGMSIVSPIISIYAKSFGVTLAIASLAITMNAFGRFAADIPSGVAADRWGRRPVMIVGSILITLMAFANATATDFTLFLAYRFLQGVGSAMWMTSRQTLLADILKPSERGRIMGWFQAFMLIGQSAGSVFGGWAAAAWGLRAPFYFYAATGLVTALLTYFLIHEPKGVTRHGGEAHMPGIEDAKRLLKNATYAMACLATFSVFFHRGGINTTLLPIYMGGSLGFDPAAIGNILGYVTLTQLIIVVPIGYAIDLLGRKPVIVWNTVLLAVANAAFLFTRDYWTMSVAAVILGFALGGAGQAPLALATDASYHEKRGLAMGFYRLVGDVGSMVGPLILSGIADAAGIQAPFWAMTGMLLVNAACIFLFAKEVIDTRASREELMRKGFGVGPFKFGGSAQS